MDEDVHNRPDRTAILIAAMEATIDAMDSVTRDVFLRHRLDGWSYERIALEYGMSVTAVEAHIARAVGTLDLGLRRLGQ